MSILLSWSTRNLLDLHIGAEGVPLINITKGYKLNLSSMSSKTSLRSLLNSLDRTLHTQQECYQESLFLDS